MIKEKMLASAMKNIDTKVFTRLLEVIESLHAQQEIQTKETIRLRLFQEMPEMVTKSSFKEINEQIELEIEKHQELM